MKQELLFVKPIRITKVVEINTGLVSILHSPTLRASRKTSPSKLQRHYVTERQKNAGHLFNLNTCCRQLGSLRSSNDQFVSLFSHDGKQRVYRGMDVLPILSLERSTFHGSGPGTSFFPQTGSWLIEDFVF